MGRYAFDVFRPDGAETVSSLRNRRLFAFADCGVPDGSKSTFLQIRLASDTS